MKDDNICARWFDEGNVGAAVPDSASLTVLLVTESAEPSGLGEHMITLARTLPRGVRPTLLFPGTHSGLATARRARAAGLPALTLPWAAVRLGSSTLASLLERLRPDIVHVHAGIPEEGHRIAAAAKSAGAGAVVRTEHQPYTLSTLRVRTPKISVLEREYRCGVEHVDHIICVSHAARQTFRMARVRVPFSVVHNGIVAHAAGITPKAMRASLGIGDAPLILTVARYVRQKRHITLLEALPRLLEHCPRAMLAWVGTGPLEAPLRSRADELGVADHILFLGARSDVPDLMDAADLLCLPSCYEAHPLVILEAFAAGLPVIAARALGITEAVQDGENGLLFPVNSPPMLAHTLARVLADPDLLERLRIAGPAATRKFTAARMASETIAVYRQAMAMPNMLAPTRTPLLA
ncbi:glycosyltransferase family 4 protein [Massilia horti]|uniref:Glycosyltransferase family 1 protein n=1 Tax=Massilia horti TaxID=2562153 RepID=A0A4Y9T214_9BURK|nr:glycosyltransferase family 4 protein [Massilia horti]TFW31934.1 glycosyltransferase family 1 protein [Massilia horti]